MTTAILVLTPAGVVLGGRNWGTPARVPGVRLVTDVSGPLAAVLAVSALVCLTVAAALTVPGARMRWTDPAALGWMGVALSLAVGVASVVGRGRRREVEAGTHV